MTSGTTLDRHDRHAASWIVALGLILVSHAAGAVGAFTTDPAYYADIARPPWAPPGWVFGPVWLTLYTLMGVAAWLIWRTEDGRDRTTALALFAAQLALNAIWTPVFFGARSIGGALVVIALLNVAILATIVAFGRRSQLAAWLLVPYATWVGFATALNTELWRLN